MFFFEKLKKSDGTVLSLTLKVVITTPVGTLHLLVISLKHEGKHQKMVISGRGKSHVEENSVFILGIFIDIWTFF